MAVQYRPPILAETDPLAAAALASHTADATAVHGITDTALLITQGNIGQHAPVPDLSPYATLTGLAAHEADTTAVHGITDTARLITQDNIATYAPPPDLSALVTLAPATSARNTITPGGTAVVPLVVKGVAGQTANLTEWQNSAGVVKASIDASGRIAGDRLELSGTAGSGGIVANYITANVTAKAAYFEDVAQTYAYMQTATDATHGFTVGSRLATRVPLSVKGAASQTANLQEWQNSAGAVLARVSSTGDLVGSSAWLGNSAGALRLGGLTVLGSAGTTLSLNGNDYFTTLDLHAGNAARARLDPLGDVSVLTAGKGVVVKSPDGLTTRRIGIDNTGAIVATV